MKIAVTGGNGELGRNVIPYLLEEGHDVVSLDLSIPPTVGAEPVQIPPRLVVDVTDFGGVVAGLSGCDAVIHFAAIRMPINHPYPTVYATNTTGSYNVLYAAAILGIKRVCLASSINAIGGVFSVEPNYDYFPVDEHHPTYAEDPYSLSKWVLEQQADAFARRYDWMSIASLRFHWSLDKRETAIRLTQKFEESAIRHLWAYTLFSEANRACLLSLTADFSGHEVFYIAAPQSAMNVPSKALAEKYYPDVPLKTEMAGTTSFFDSSKAGRILGWYHEEN